PGGHRGCGPTARPCHAHRLAWRQRADALAEGVRAARDVHAAAGAGPVEAPAARARVGRGLREPLERDRRLRRLPAPEDRLRRDRDGARVRVSAAAVSRLSVRLRLTLAFAAAMAILLIAFGLVVYTRFEDSLND